MVCIRRNHCRLMLKLLLTQLITTAIATVDDGTTTASRSSEPLYTTPKHKTVNHWAVIVAGSSGYENYRHQADACHAYHILRNNSIPASNIITMMFDDVASMWRNLHHGKLYNRPWQFNHSEPLVDVYEGCQIDYRGEQVTPEIFLQVLTGNATDNVPKVLESTEADRVFVFFTDHGATGLVAFPNGNLLYASELYSALSTMQEQKMYNDLVIYLEACESGSMFEDFDMSDMTNVYVTTAANAEESSMATYCPPFGDWVHGLPMNTCLGDTFSVSWMEDSDNNRKSLMTETLFQQYERVKNETIYSHVMIYGNSEIAKEYHVGDFQSDADEEESSITGRDGAERLCTK